MSIVTVRSGWYEIDIEATGHSTPGRVPGIVKAVRVIDLSDAEYLRSRRTLSQEQVDAIERRRSERSGPYQPHEHHSDYGQAGH